MPKLMKIIASQNTTTTSRAVDTDLPPCSSISPRVWPSSIASVGRLGLEQPMGVVLRRQRLDLVEDAARVADRGIGGRVRPELVRPGETRRSRSELADLLRLRAVVREDVVEEDEP